MLSLFVSLVLLFQPTPNDTTSVDSDIVSATVFLSGAEVHRSATLTLQTGANYLNFYGLSTSLNEETIQLRTNSDIVLESIAKSTNRGNQRTNNNQIKQLESRKEQIEDSINHKEAELTVLNKRLNFLTANQDLSGDNTKISANEIRQAMDYFSREFEEIENQQIKVRSELAIFKEQLNEVNRKLGEIKINARRSSGIIELAVYSESRREVAFNLSYFVPEARWQPSYDVRVDDTDGPVDLIYKANIAQNTGVEWNNVALTISSGEPRSDTSIPTINPIYLEFYEPRRQVEPAAQKARAEFDMMNMRTAGEAGISRITGVVRDANSGEPLRGANIYSPTVKEGTTTDRNGRFSMNINPNAKVIRVRYIGYQSQTRAINSSTINVNLQPGQGLNEVVVTGYGSSVESELRKGQTAFSFEIKNPYTIKSGAEEKTVAVESYTIPASYNYFAIPKKRETALLTAKVTDWSSLNLLSGDANLFLDDSFVGKTEINPAAVDDTLTFSLGEDKGINLERTQIEAFKEKNFFGNKVTETKGWEISIRNAKSSPIKINLLDQIPVTSNEDIDVELTERSGADFNRSTGELRWEIDLDAGEAQTLQFVYEITYPDDKRLQQKGN